MLFDDLALFIKLAEVANYTKTASILNITQPTLTRRIKYIEKSIGSLLIKRNSRNFELTREGEIIYQKLVDPIKKQQTILTNYIQNKQTMRGTLKIALPAALAYELITPKIDQFTKKYPQVKLFITYTATPINLIQDNFNLAISTTLPVSQSSKVRLLKNYKLKLYASPNYISRYGKPIRLEELHSHNNVGMIDIDGTIRTQYKVINLITKEEQIFDINPNIYINNILHGILLVKSGSFIVGVFDGLIEKELKDVELVPILPEYALGEVSCYLIRHNQALSKLEQYFIDFLLACFED